MGTTKRTERIVGRMERRELGDHDEAHILVMGDLHVGDSHADLDMIREAVEWLQGAENRYAFLVGDLINAGIRDSVSDVYSEAMTVGDSIDWLVKILSPVNKKILGVVSGNHDHRVYKQVGLDVCAVIAARAELPYSMGQAFLNLRVGWWEHLSRNQRPSPVCYAAYLTHGFGGGRMVGGKANNLMRLGDIVSADLYCSGHTHSPLIIPSVHWLCDMQSGNVMEQKRLFVATGASLDRGNGYAVRFGFPALAKTWPIVTLNGRRKEMTATV